MSFEGYYQVKCVNKHYYTEDCYTFSYSDPCKVCGESVMAIMVDQTNGDGVEDEVFMEGCDRQVTIWQSTVDEMKDDMFKIITAYRKYRFTREYSAEDALMIELIKKYSLRENT